ncbi:unnamed protein product [Echinostoma caproni]|uniref:VWFC domain-containing protein n=1 Tax=Echinostoma caproni TaxID=27848 RepID=A0A183AV94_9TREM|nr:unnamed protein product [Echinostoma caproni]
MMDRSRLRLDGTMEDTDESAPTHIGQDGSQGAESEMWGQPSPGGTTPPSLLKIGPGLGVALPQGRCYCVNATVLCARPGRHIWHDQDCYFVDRLETAYYAPDARWTPAGDPCTECRCLQNQTYTCAPKRCARTFLCPKGQQPRTRRGECCPSYCGAPTLIGE